VGYWNVWDSPCGIHSTPHHRYTTNIYTNKHSDSIGILCKNNKILSDPTTPAPTSISHEKAGQEGKYDIKDMVGGDHDGQNGGDPPSACTCHSTPIGCGPGFTQNCVSLARTVTHHPGDGTNMDDTGMELPDKTVQPKPWEEWLCGYYNKEVLVNSL
jgi:hypothetical protein